MSNGSYRLSQKLRFDLMTMTHAISRRTTLMATLSAVLVLTSFVLWAQRGLAQCDEPVVSSAGSYRIKVCTPAFSLFVMHGTMPRYVEFFDVRRQRSLGSSAIVDFSGRGQTVWPRPDSLNIIVGLGDDAPNVRVPAPDGQ